jgi:hypothetical protein
MRSARSRVIFLRAAPADSIRDHIVKPLNIALSWSVGNDSGRRGLPGGAEGIQTNGHRGTSAHALTFGAVLRLGRIKSTWSGSSWARGNRAAWTSNASSVSPKPPAPISRPHTAEGTPLDPALDRRCSPCPTPQPRPGDEGRTEPRNRSTTMSPRLVTLSIAVSVARGRPPATGFL